MVIDQFRQPPQPEERVYKRNNRWYFRTREDSERGPFIDKQQAYWALAKYIRQQCSFR